jgi:hypothetical protein
MNAFLLPGMGQLLLGRRVTGIIIILIVNFLMLLALFVLLKGASPIIAAKITAGQVGYNEVSSAIEGVSGYGKALLAAFGVVWGFAMYDVIRNGQTHGEPGDE